jgi:hypothetical protein
MATTAAKGTQTGKHPATAMVCQCIKAVQNSISVCETLLIFLQGQDFIMELKLFYFPTRQK